MESFEAISQWEEDPTQLSVFIASLDPDGLRQFEMKTGSVRAAPRHPDIQQGIHRADVRPDCPLALLM
jgi:hypothetical protein